MIDTLLLRDLELRTRIGVSETERADEQRVLVTMELMIDAQVVAKSDDVTGSIDYAVVAESVKVLAKTERKTIERLAEDIARLVLTRFHPSSVTVTVTKFPPLGTRQVELRVTRP